MSFHSYHRATNWIYSQKLIRHSGIFQLIDEAADKWDLDPKKIEELFKKKFPDMYPLREVP